MHRQQVLHFVFLQGMPCNFFSRIARELSRRGHRASGITLCPGDRIFWRGPESVPFTGKIEDWPAFIGDFFDRHQVSDLILLGEQRNYHKPAIEAAKARGIRVTVTDFGYLRPDWITLEPDGMNGNSTFPTDPAEIRRLAVGLPAPDLGQRFHDSALAMALGDLTYSFANVFLRWLTPHYRQSDKRPHPLIYFPMTGLNLLNRRLTRTAVDRLQADILSSDQKFFLFPLQLAHDFQIVAYSPFDRLDDAILVVLRSFARHAAEDRRLVVKVHPWDPGLHRWQAFIRREARQLGIERRVFYLNGGALDPLISKAEGMVTVNSTSGIRAVQLGCPVVTLGQAIYHVAGLSHQTGLDRFWATPERPDPALTQAFITALVGQTQIRGVFFQDPGQAAAVQAVTERLLARAATTLNAPLPPS
jgi:capsular polysaccharide export protein